MTDELRKPLGLPAPSGAPRRRVPLAALLAPSLAILAAGAGFGVWKMIEGAPPAVVAIKSATDPTITASIKSAPKPPLPGEPGLTEVNPVGDLAEVTRKSGTDIVISDPSAPRPVQLAALPREDLVEKSSYGPLPRIGADGTRPLDAYARPADAVGKLIPVAIVVGGIGLNSSGDRAALAGLPGAVTLALVPYGDHMAATLADARGGGHEILLQVPLEPYGYPDVDPGPKTLTTTASPAENLDRLHWLMSRLTTYVGLVNYMGARFTGQADKMAPLLAEARKRGLLYLDDGSSGRSVAAAAGSAPFLRADIVLDADTDPKAIDARLDELVATARTKGFAIATGSAFPVTVDRIATFARVAARLGIVIVPITAMLPAKS